MLIQSSYAGTIEAKAFISSEQQKRYQDLIEDIRCPVCQGQSIGDSNSGLALDLREQVRKMILNNNTNDEIYSFMVQRYGDFVIFKPPIKPATYMLWFAPFLFLFICLFILFRSISSRPKIEKTN
ncbi:MAG TPA: cytochrome c-type biogenesis protein [Gammaproteobacteria bacterium]|nr:cytochrome c-type biogenesis protein [Gammaproteobacteria bacterium]